MVTSSWVEDDGENYFVNSSGQKVVNDWRLTTPLDDDSADEEWYYFQSTGKMAKDKKLVIKGKTYFFDSEGIMLTGWVKYDSDSRTATEADGFEENKTFYTDETGARVQSNWVESYEIGLDEEDASGDDDYYWYYLKSDGDVAVDKVTNIKGKTYFFDTEGKMLNGWVRKVASDSNAGITYNEIDGEDSDVVISDVIEEDGAVYYCGESGAMKKNVWVKTWRPADAYDEDDDDDKFWYWIDKNGEVYAPDLAEESTSKKTSQAIRYKFDEGNFISKDDEKISVTEKSVNSKTYLFNANGEMISKFIMIEKDDEMNMYYYGGSDDGSMKTGSMSIEDESGEPYKFYFGSKERPETVKGMGDGYLKGEGITGAYSGKLYCYGVLVKAEDYRYELANVDGKTFIVNSSGSIQTSSKEYTEDGSTIINADDWEFNTDSKYTFKGSFESGTPDDDAPEVVVPTVE